MNHSVAIGIQCRLSSSRLPGKALLRLGSSSVLGFLVKRALGSGFPVYLLTSDRDEDDLLQHEALLHGVSGVIRGPLDNVIARYEMLAESASCDFIVRVTADNPLTEFRFVAPLVNILSKASLSGYACVDFSRCPEGLNLEVISVPMLLKSSVADSSDYNLEHVTPWLKRQDGAIDNFWDPLLIGSQADKLRGFSFTIDHLKDYIKVASLVNLALNVNDADFADEQFVSSAIQLALDDSVAYPGGRNHIS